MYSIKFRSLPLVLLIFLGFSMIATAKEVAVVGTFTNHTPNLPKKVRIAHKEIPVIWENVTPDLFKTNFEKVSVEGIANANGEKINVTASVWVFPENLVYLIDAGRISPDQSQIFKAAKSLRGKALLNELPDKKYASDTDKWGYLDPDLQKDQGIQIHTGDEQDWASSFISGNMSKDNHKKKGIKYKLSLEPGIYNIIVAHVPRIALSFMSGLRVNNARVNTATLKTTVSEDQIHPPVFVTHHLRLTKTSTITYETDKLTGNFWENASISLIAVEKVASDIAAPAISRGSGDFWEPLEVNLTHSDPEAEIFYTLDGNKPDRNSIRFSTSFVVDKTTQINAIAYVNNKASDIVTADYSINAWAVTATEFKLVGETDVKNVKLNWAQRNDANIYKIYRDGELIGQTKGDTYDDYDLAVGKAYTYYAEAYKNDSKLATSLSQKAVTFTPSGNGDIYDNSNGKYIDQNKNKPQGIKIGNLYFSYTIENFEKNGKKGRVIYERYSSSGLPGSWSTSRELAFYPNSRFEGVGFRYNKKTKKVVVSAHYEENSGYEAAKIYLAQITPQRELEVGWLGRPLGYDSRDQSLFIDDDGSGYLLSATRMNNDINIYKLDNSWTKPVSLVNTIFIGQHRETPSIIKKGGKYYFFSSKASGWYPSQTMYASSSDLGGLWTTLREIGNNSTFGSQSNTIDKFGTGRETFGLRSYHWGAQQHYKDPDGNYSRILVVSFNSGYASMDYYRQLEIDDQHGIIPIQAGKNLTLNRPVTATAASQNGEANCITDGAALLSSSYFQGGSYPYSLTIDMQKKAKISEINLSTRLIGGSETAYKYTLEGSIDGHNYTLLYDGTNNWQVGFQILNIRKKAEYRYLRLNVIRIINVQNNSSATWAEGVYELSAFGTTS